MTDPWYGPQDEDVVWIGRAAIVMGAVGVTLGVLTVSAVVWTADHLLRRGRR